MRDVGKELRLEFIELLHLAVQGFQFRMSTFQFSAQASTSNVVGGLGGGVVTASITVNPVAAKVVSTVEFIRRRVSQHGPRHAVEPEPYQSRQPPPPLRSLSSPL